MNIYTTTSGEETQALGKKLAKKLKSPRIIALVSDLGGGKTTLMQGIAKGLDIKEKVVSPTFVLERIYQIPKRDFALHHYDLYRIDPDDILIDEILENAKDNIVAIEWAEKIQDKLPKNTMRINIDIINERRKITIHNE